MATQQQPFGLHLAAWRTSLCPSGSHLPRGGWLAERACKLIKVVNRPYWWISKSRVITAADVAHYFPSGFALTSTGNAYELTNASACANSADEKQDGSKYGFTRKSVRSAAPVMWITDVMGQWSHRVKLHSPPQSAIGQSDEVGVQ